MSNTRIPITNIEYRNYVVDGNTYLKQIVTGVITRGIHLGMLPAEMTTLDNFATSTDTKYTQNANKNTKNKVTAKNYEDEKTAFRNFFSPILNRISGSPNITSPDRLQLNIAEPVTTHTTPGDITDQCIVGFKQFGGGKMKGSCKSLADQSRASMANNADGVKFHYSIVDQPATLDPTPENGGIVKADELESPEAATNKEFFSGATFTLELGATNSGRKLLYYIRWFNSKHPGKAGPWMGPYNLNIL